MYALTGSQKAVPSWIASPSGGEPFQRTPKPVHRPAIYNRRTGFLQLVWNKAKHKQSRAVGLPESANVSKQ